MAFELYDYQDRSLAQVREAYSQKHRRIMLQLPTGAGKTVVAAAMTGTARRKNKKVLFTVPFIELVDQTIERFAEDGITDIGVIQGKNRLEDWDQPIQIASVQTLMKRWPNLPEYDVAIVDEAHRWYKFYEKWMEADEYLDRPIIGLSATPWSKGLGRWYSKLIRPVSMQDLIDAGRLSPFRVFAPTHPDLKDVKISCGDYHEGELSEYMRKPDLIGDVVQTWEDSAQDRQTLVFAVDSAHARVLTQQFLDKGIPTARVYSDCDGHHQDAGERREIRAAFAAGSIKVVVNVGVLTHGVDWDVRCLQIARPTKSEILHVQIIGRALRTAPGKDYALLLDHSDNHLRLGFVTDIHHEQLSDGRQATQKEAKAALPPPLTPKECVKCKVLKPPRTPKCPVCGYINQVLCTIRTAEGKLAEISEGEFEAIRKRMQQERKQTGLLDTEYPRMVYAQLRWVCRERGYKPGWSSNKHREKYGEWPPRAWNSDPLFEPTRGLMKWLNASQFRFVKGYH